LQPFLCIELVIRVTVHYKLLREFGGFLFYLLVFGPATLLVYRVCISSLAICGLTLEFVITDMCTGCSGILELKLR